MVVGGLLHNPEQPAWFVPVAGRLYFRKSQLPDPGSSGGPAVLFQTKCELMVELGPPPATARPGKNLLILDGGYAVASVVRAPGPPMRSAAR